jgi:hypothetical protein
MPSVRAGQGTLLECRQYELNRVLYLNAVQYELDRVLYLNAVSTS